MATARRVAATRLQAVRAETIAEQVRAPAKPLASYFVGAAKTSRKPSGKPGA